VRNLGTYELPEDLQLGPNLDVSVWQGMHALGSDAHFTRPSLTASWTFPWCRDGYVRPSAGTFSAAYRLARPPPRPEAIVTYCRPLCV